MSRKSDQRAKRDASEKDQSEMRLKTKFPWRYKTREPVLVVAPVDFCMTFTCSYSPYLSYCIDAALPKTTIEFRDNLEQTIARVINVATHD